MKVDNKKIKFKIYTLGCKVNQYDSAVLDSKLILDNFCHSKKDFNLIIINSCSVTKSAVSKSNSLINFVKKNNPKAKIVLIGCWPKIYKIDNLKIDLILNSKNQEEIISNIKKLFFDVNYQKILENKKEKPGCFLSPMEDRSRYFIKIQDGCEQFCSYCVIPLARGPLKSRPVDEVLDEIQKAVDSGFEEIILSGIHLGLYGADFKNKKNNLYFLLKKILKIKKLGRIRLSSIEITEINDKIIDLISKNKKICRHLHIPLQSGNDKILKLMNRPYNTKYFLNRVKKIRKKVLDIAITTDIIVGFPGETKKDFVDTYNFAKKIFFSKIHVFSFSAHEKAPAYNFPNKVDVLEIKNRSKKLRGLSKELERDYKRKILSKYNSLEILIESIINNKIRSKSEFYFDIYIYLKDFYKKYPALSNNKTNLTGKLFNYQIKN